MAEKRLAAESPIQNIKEVSKALLAMGVANAEYYVDIEGHLPYFCVGKEFKKEMDDDPDIVNIFVDVDENEVSVYGRFIHEHFSNVAYALALIQGLLDGSIAEVGIVLHGVIGGFFGKNTKDPRKNICVVERNVSQIVKELGNPMLHSGQVHKHQYLQDAHPFSAYYGPFSEPMPEGCRAYFFSSVFGEYPEVYCIE